MIDIEIELARALGWSLYDIDRTDIGSLLPFIARLSSHNARGPETGTNTNARRVYCDQVNL